MHASRVAGDDPTVVLATARLFVHKLRIAIQNQSHASSASSRRRAMRDSARDVLWRMSPPGGRIVAATGHYGPSRVSRTDISSFCLPFVNRQAASNIPFACSATG